MTYNKKKIHSIIVTIFQRVCVIYVTHHLYYLIGFLSDRGDVKLDYSIIGKNIRKIRTEKKMRQKEFIQAFSLYT